MRSAFMQRLRRGLLLALLGAALPAAAESGTPSAEDATSDSREHTGLSAAEQERYFHELRRLYPKKTERQALLEHCNRLLESHALRAGYLDGQPRNQRLRDDRLFSLSISAPGELTVRAETRSEDGSHLQVRSQRLNLFGVDPFVRYQCPERGPSCSVLSPVDGSELLVVVRDRPGVAELARALSFLIRDIQRG